VKTRFLLAIPLLFIHLFSAAQSHESESDDSIKVNINSIEDFTRKSKWSLHSRSYFMSTINEGALKDDYALAQGAGIGLLTVPIKGFQLGVAGYFIFNLVSSDLSKYDPISGGNNRYEIGQFDVSNPKNKHDLDRLEDLFLKYSYRKNSITIGRMELNTPFMNLQDGRMRPSLEEAVWLNIHQFKKVKINGGYVWGVSPRSTIQFYDLKSSVGIYGQGVNTDGTKSNYFNNIASKGFYMGNANIKPFKKFEINLWNGFFENVSNTALIELKNEYAKNEHVNFYQGLMYFRQDAVNNGGNANQTQTYMNKGAQSNVLSARIGLKRKSLDININYTHITGDGRYLMPREWGRDPFYTFMARERNEGAGNVHAANSNITYTSKNQNLKSTLAYGYYQMPSVTDTRLNKYGMPSYHQINLSSAYTFKNFWRGLELGFLVASKIKSGNDYLAPKYIYNKVNMTNFSLVADLKI
jgi:hypothetical protein